MIVDFHTHVFNDLLAPRALASLKEGCHGLYEPVHDMTIAGITEAMNKFGVDISVTQPIVTKQSQFLKINDWQISTSSDRIVPFGGLYPHTDDYKRDIDYIVSLGFKGIKLHAEYQNFIIDAPWMMKIYDYAFNKGLIIIQHAGFDPAFPPPFKSSPQQFAKIVDELKGGVMIAAHFGGHDQWEDVERYMVGHNIYLDTSMGTRYYPKDLFLRVVQNHGADKILFATDSPWSNASEEIDYIKGLSLTEEEKNAIFSENASRLLKL